ncbi:uncharacterized protein EKO05_0006153 [Ascochyta rabiei]|uniref:uncharacterized protein n=1 Tax=Didymella rabiei TaxID=5454 RepID=UPI0022085C7A|nr:uncharacterized protein EKO05_0006153 [Ascochyta rabiei]UPX15713.1 hypothetical protein EKO05_0006153 [Ascochyta rabiei]
MRLSFIAFLLVQTMMASASKQFCDYGTALTGDRTCKGIAANSYCCSGRQSSTTPIYRSACYSPKNSEGDVLDQVCSGGTISCCD